MLHSFDQLAAAAPPQPRWGGLSAVAVAVLGIGLLLTAFATVITVGLIPLYLSQKQLSVTKPSCNACSISIRNKFTNTSGVYERNVGYYSCDKFCASRLSSGAAGADDASYNFASDAATALGSASYTCNIAASTGRNCTNSYGNYSSLAGLFYASNRGVCSTPYGGYRCCCASGSGR